MPYTNRYITAALPLALVAAAGGLGGAAVHRNELVAVVMLACLLLTRLLALTGFTGGWLGHARVAAVVLMAAALAGRSARWKAVAAALAVFATMSLPGYESWLRTGAVHVRDDASFARLGVRIAQTTDADARIAVVLAGAIPYFADRPAIDVLGKNDPVIARHAPVMEFAPGHDRFDYEHSIGTLAPDLVTQTWARPELYFAVLKERGYVQVFGTVFSKPGSGSVDVERLRMLLAQDAADVAAELVDSGAIER